MVNRHGEVIRTITILQFYGLPSFDYFLSIHRFWFLMCNLFIVLTTVVQGFDLKCEVKKGDWTFVGLIEFCETQNLNITSTNETITSVNGRTESTNMQAIVIPSQLVHYLPKGIDKFFPNLKGLSVFNSNLKSVMQDDFKPFTQLKFVGFLRNDLETLDNDLFEFNPKLVYGHGH